MVAEINKIQPVSSVPQFLTLTAPISKPFVPLVSEPSSSAIVSPSLSTSTASSSEEVIPNMSIHHSRADSTSSQASL
ncbi:uncharacterized protein SAPINGB_P000209 [Magnusiomyces paraingens]|uniref:Uncharacterized protein n=1 Tax=Magnusiomyces paraingens TaxID=2606893 RepID=A0A5E8AYY8_9ASCO|nr:uncharacterized protein SAPINGB_P000209 [Saprochaete ingens]VVT43914.1 unnamed protein product [Saprochaete ingens]